MGRLAGRGQVVVSLARNAPIKACLRRFAIETDACRCDVSRRWPVISRQDKPPGGFCHNVIEVYGRSTP